MYGYNDYSGPSDYRRRLERLRLRCDAEAPTNSTQYIGEDSSEDDDDEHDPLTVGRWMDGDSLAPPCGSAVPIVHEWLEFAGLKRRRPRSNDDENDENDDDDVVLYDLGCGDGRVCLEAFRWYRCRHCVGVEIEPELVERFRTLIETEAENDDGDDERLRRANDVVQAVQRDLRDVLQELADAAEGRATSTSLPTPTVICTYLLPDAMRAIRPNLVRLLRSVPGLRVVCNTWGPEKLRAIETMEATEGIEGAATLTLFTSESLTGEDAESAS